MTVACVLYSEFDDVAGTRVLYQDPEGFLSTEIFYALSEYIILIYNKTNIFIMGSCHFIKS